MLNRTIVYAQEHFRSEVLMHRNILKEKKLNPIIYIMHLQF